MKIVIIGAGKNGYVILNAIQKKVSVLGFLDDIKTGDDVLGPISSYKKYKKDFKYNQLNFVKNAK